MQIRLKGFEPATETFARKTDAQRWAAATETAMREGRYVPEQQSRKRTLAELIDRYIAQVAPEKKTAKKVERQLGWWREHHGFRLLSALTPDTSLLRGVLDELMERGHIAYPVGDHDVPPCFALNPDAIEASDD